VESKARYKGRVAELMGKQAAALDRIQELEAVVEEGESDRLELQRELEEAQVSGGTELEMLKPVVEESSKERADYMEWKATGTRRMELARELAGVEEDQACLGGTCYSWRESARSMRFCEECRKRRWRRWRKNYRQWRNMVKWHRLVPWSWCEIVWARVKFLLFSTAT